MRVHGVDVPALCYGTAWKEEQTAPLVRLALDAGFRAIDTANQRKHYVEAAVGDALAAAIADGVVTRAAVFVQTKFTYARGQDHRLPYDPAAPLATQVAQSLASSLAHLHTDYVDSYVLHGPALADGLADADATVWQAMEAAHRAGTARLLGVSNITLAQLRQLHALARVPIACVQNRCYASTGWDADVRAFCRTHGILYQGFSLLTANRAPLQRPVVDEIALRHGCTREQVVFAFALAVGMLPLTGTTSEAHMRADLAAVAVRLSDAEVAAIETIAHAP